MSDTAAGLDAQVVVVGAGPCGVTLANHLGMHGIRTVLIERSRDILDYPRAVGVDDEALRSWQAVGLAEETLRDMIQNVPARYHNSKGRCFAEVRPSAQPFGWPRRNIFMQPLTERALRRGLERYPSVSMRPGCEVHGLEQDARGVTVSARTDTGDALTLRAAYVVGTDGGRSTVRRLIGVELEGTTLASKWLVVDVEDDTIYEPYSGVYCHPVRPHMSIDLPYGFRRFEFMLLPGESEEAIQSVAEVERLLRPHYAGKPMPTIKRSRVYLHHSRIAGRFKVGRVFIAGDAAHLQPPFFGQGMNSGIRDATNLAWKLCAVLAGRAGEGILASYDAERRDHALAMVNIATWFGKFYRPANRAYEIMRDAFFDLVQGLPGIRDYILQLRFKPMPRYVQGIVVHRGPIGRGSAVGRMFMQPRVETADRRTLRLDDAIGNGFAVIGVNVDPARHMASGDLEFWNGLGARIVQVNKSRLGGRHLVPPSSGTLLLDDVEGGFRDWLMERPAQEIIVLRPDRYVAAICRRSEIGEVTRELRRLLA